MHASAHPTRAGFSLLHLLIALVGVSVVATLAIPRYFSHAHITLENAAVLLAQDLRTAQNRAAYSSETLFFRFFPDGDGYEVVTKSGQQVSDPRTGRAFVRRYSSDAVYRGVQIDSLVAGDDGTLVLTPFGEISDAVTARLVFEGRERVVRAARSSGIVTIEGSTSGFVDDGY